jgi:hypothetical protein
VKQTLLSLFLLFLYFNHFATFVKPALGTDRMWKAHRTAIGTGNQVGGLQSIVCSAHIAAAF